MSEQSLASQRRSVSLPIVGGLVIVTLGLLNLIASASWFSTSSRWGMLFQNIVEVLFFFILLVVPVLLAAKTSWPFWFIGAGCGFASAALLQIGIRGAPADAEGIGSLLCAGVIIQSGVATGLALVTRLILKKLRKPGSSISQ